MTERVQELITKIKNEGIAAGQSAAQAIEEEARTKAAAIVEKARKEAASIIENAQHDARKTEQATRAALQQAARDTVLGLQATIKAILNGIVRRDIQASLSPDTIAGIIKASIDECLANKSADIDISVVLNKKDLEQLKKGFLAKLQERLKEGVQLRPSEEIEKGFTVSFDGGKSSFDFTDTSLTDYLCAYLNPDVEQILKEAIDSQKNA